MHFQSDTYFRHLTSRNGLLQSSATVRLTQVFALALWCVSTSAIAQNTNTTRPLSLRDCIQLALQHNLGLKIDRYSAEIAHYGLQAAYGGYDPAFQFKA